MLRRLLCLIGLRRWQPRAQYAEWGCAYCDATDWDERYLFWELPHRRE